MKHVTLRIIAVCGIILLSYSSQAQKGLQIGIRYMPTMTGLWNKDDKAAGAELQKEHMRSLITGGLAFDYWLSKSKGIEVDVIYSRQGQDYTGTNMQSGSTTAYNRVVAKQAILNTTSTVGTYQAKAELNSYKIPILFKLSTPNTKKTYYTLSVGPQINYLNDAVYELNGKDILLPGSGIEPSDAYKKVTFDAVAGFGLGYNVMKHLVLTAQARFDYGLQDVEKKDVTINPSIKYYPANRSATHNATSSLVFGVSYKL